jgi:quercetin dioxygenase-like cupin family protein
MNIAKIIARGFSLIAVTLAVGATVASAQPVQTAMNEAERPAASATPHAWGTPANGPANASTLLHTSEIPGMPGKELRVFRTVYPPGAVNSKHYHTSQVVFYIIEGSGVWQEEGQPPVTLKAGDTMLVMPGTIHAHWNASATDQLVSHEVVIIDHGQRSTIKMP